MKDQYGETIPASWVKEMGSLLKRHGYDPRAAARLAAEGMGPEGLTDRLRIPAGEVGSLSYTHNIHPRPKFRLGDKVEDAEGSRRGEVSFVGTYQGEQYGGWAYKVKEADGKRNYWPESKMRLVRRGR